MSKSAFHWGKKIKITETFNEQTQLPDINKMVRGETEEDVKLPVF